VELLHWLFGILRLIPFNLQKKTFRFEFDPATFKECTSKEVKQWSWKRVKFRKFVVHFKDGKFVIQEFD